MNSFFKRVAGALAALSLAIFSMVGYYSEALPDSYFVTGRTMPSFGKYLTAERVEDDVLSASSGETSLGYENDVAETASIKILGIIPIKDAQIRHTEEKYLIPGGTPVGIKLLAEGVVVVSIKDSGPADAAGIEPGDCIISANGETMTSSNRLATLIANSHGEEITLTVKRNSREFSTMLMPEFSEEDGSYKAGLWIKDSSAGVGTLTYIDPETGEFGALGHPISESQTQSIMPLGSGEIVDVTITGCDKGSCGTPGELFGTFLSGLAAGNILRNCEQGIFGSLNYVGAHSNAIPIAYKGEVETGPATILTTVDGSKPKEYAIEIEKLSLGASAETKNLVIRVTDPELLSITGGIVQGMSGSPIIQNGKLIGAITHVFVSDPSRGYGIFIENMLQANGELN